MSADPAATLLAYERVCAASLRQRASAGLAPPPRVPVARLDSATRKLIGLDDATYKICAGPFDFADACTPNRPAQDDDDCQVNTLGGDAAGDYVADVSISGSSGSSGSSSSSSSGSSGSSSSGSSSSDSSDTSDDDNDVDVPGGTVGVGGGDGNGDGNGDGDLSGDIDFDLSESYDRDGAEKNAPDGLTSDLSSTMM